MAHRGLVGNSLMFLRSTDVRLIAQIDNHKKIYKKVDLKSDSIIQEMRSVSSFSH